MKWERNVFALLWYKIKQIFFSQRYILTRLTLTILIDMGEIRRALLVSRFIKCIFFSIDNEYIRLQNNVKSTRTIFLARHSNGERQWTAATIANFSNLHWPRFRFFFSSRILNERLVWVDDGGEQRGGGRREKERERERERRDTRWVAREKRVAGQGGSQVKIDATERDLCVGNAGDRAWKINFQGFPGRRPVGGDLGNGRAFWTLLSFSLAVACVEDGEEEERKGERSRRVYLSATICERARIRSRCA